MVLTGGYDGTTRLWDTATGKELATLVSFRDGGWAVTTPEGHFDTPDITNVKGIHWVQGDDVILPEQLNLRRFYTPGLLSIVTCPYRQTSGCPQLPQVGDLRKIGLRPEVAVMPPKPGSTLAKVVVRNRGGGIGDLVVRVNGRDLPLSTRSKKPSPTAKSAEVWVDLAGAPLDPKGENRVEISAYDKDNIARFPGNVVTYRTPVKEALPAELWGIVVGTSTYAEASLNLKYPDKDAASFALALRLGAERLLGNPARVHIETLTSNGSVPPTKTQIQRAIEVATRQMKPNDVLVVYFAGHGVAWNGTYYYLTAEARGADVGADAKLRQSATVSSEELANWLRKPATRKVVVILDTCAAGAAAGSFESIVTKRELSDDHKKALRLLQDVDYSYHFLMGSAADRVSYEASRYGQGLLTYALLFGMQGAAQSADGNLDVEGLFRVAEEQVPRLAEGIGGIQKPDKRLGRNFPLARYAKEDAERIPLQREKPVLVQVVCLTASLSDPLRLGPKVDEALRSAAEPVTRGAGSPDPALVYLWQVREEIPKSFSPRVLYELRGEKVVVRVRLMRDEMVAAEAEFESATADSGLTQRVVELLIMQVSEVGGGK